MDVLYIPELDKARQLVYGESKHRTERKTKIVGDVMVISCAVRYGETRTKIKPNLSPFVRVEKSRNLRNP